MTSKKKRNATASHGNPKKPGPHASIHEAGVFRIRVAGRLDPSWAERTGGMTVVVHEEGGPNATTELRGLVQDQAALMGILDQLYVLGVPVLKVERFGSAKSRSGLAATNQGEALSEFTTGETRS